VKQQIGTRRQHKGTELYHEPPPNESNTNQHDPIMQQFTTLMLTLGHLAAITAMVGPPTYPAPMQQIFRSHSLILAIFQLYFVKVLRNAMLYDNIISNSLGGAALSFI
jgi:hypothetical protein